MAYAFFKQCMVKLDAYLIGLMLIPQVTTTEMSQPG
jgi:hypothetical protein